VPERKVWFGCSLGAWNGADVASAAESVRLVVQADRDGLDLFTVADHPYFAEKLDSYALLPFLLGQTGHISGAVTVTSLPSRPAPVLAHTITSLSALSGGRVVLGIGAGAIWDMIVKLGVPRLDGGSAVRAMAEAITLIRALSGGGDPVTFDGEFYHVSGLDPADVPTPPIWTGSVGPKSLAVTGRLADGWVPPGASDWQSGPGSGADRRRVQLRRPHHPRAARRHPRRGRPVDRRLGPAVDRRAHRRGARAPRERLHLPQHRRHPRVRGAGPLGHRGRPGGPGSDRRELTAPVRAGA